MSPATARSARKRDAILEAAKQAFLGHGFAAANLDDIAAAASASKVTIYSHFNSKENLFTCVLQQVIAAHSVGGPPLDPAVDSSELHSVLTAIGIDLIETVLDEEVLALRRIMIAEQPRHPAFADLWRRTTVVAATDSLTDYFAALQVRGTIADTDPRAVASQFLWMLIGDAIDSVLLGGATRPPEAQTIAEATATTIVRAYAVPPRRVSAV